MKYTFILSLFFFLVSTALVGADALPSWKKSASKRAIVDFVEAAVDPASAGFIAVPDRIAVFDNDGTLWAEKPLYFQALFAFDQIVKLAAEHSDWKTQEPYASILRGDIEGALHGGEEALIELVLASHSNMTRSAFRALVGEWVASKKHPTLNRPYTELVYQPMLELLEYLRVNQFKTYIVSGGGIEFMRVFAESVYGIPPEQVIGSSVRTEFKVVDGQPLFLRQPELDFINDKAGKPLGILKHIGRRPALAFGNSDGDFEMLEWTTAGEGARLGLLLHHTDAKREWAYDRDSHVGRLNRGLDEAAQRGWILVNMRKDWRRVFPK
ncbi:MAG: HAD family hydrolase [Coraliomargaritaceae bacterium]